jgi:hypothetical protein
MSATYSINPGTSQEANTFNQINDILNALPDNTQKLITPRDLRDVAFSNWENTVFRYTSNSSGTQYIGIDRSNIKDKIFFGKKELSGSSILSDTLLTTLSDVDLFFYNTKSDSSAAQDLKIAFLAGSNQLLHRTPPYLEVVQISGATPSLGLNITHNQTFGGDFNFGAGLNGRISVNSLVFPSVNELNTMISSASSSQSGDLFMVRSSSGYLELRTIGSINTLGSPSTITNIYGTSVEVNGYPLEFTDPNPTVVDFGGVPAGTTFSNVPLVELLRQMLYPYLAPLNSISLIRPVLERNHVSGTSSHFTYTLIKRSDNITSSTLKVVGNSTLANYAGPFVTGPGYITQTYNDSYTFSGAQIQSNISGVFTFSVSATDGIQTSSSSAKETFVYPYFYGFSATNSMTSIQTTVANDLTKLIDTYNDETVSLSGTGYLYYCYPDYYGTLNKIYDGNGFIVWQTGTSSAGWTYSSVNISSPSSIWGGTLYRVFRTTSMVTIPLPSQNYQFKFTP